MNWCGGTLPNFKRKRTSKKAEERRRIEEYIRKRQYSAQMSGSLEDATNNNAFESRSLGANFSTTSNLAPLFGQQQQISRSFDQIVKSNTNRSNISTTSNILHPTKFFKRPDDPSLSANPWAGLDSKFLKPKVFPNFLKNTPKLYFDAAVGPFTTKERDNSRNRSFQDTIATSPSHLNGDNYQPQRRSHEIDDEPEGNMNHLDDTMLPFEEEEEYGPPLPPELGSPFLRTPKYNPPSPTPSSFPTPKIPDLSTYGNSKPNNNKRTDNFQSHSRSGNKRNHNASFRSTVSRTSNHSVSSHVSPIPQPSPPSTPQKSKLEQNIAIDYVEKTRTPNQVPPRLMDFNLSQLEAPSQSLWNFEEEDQSMEDFVVFNPSGGFSDFD